MTRLFVALLTLATFVCSGFLGTESVKLGCGSCPTGQKCMINTCVTDVTCPAPERFGNGPPIPCNTWPSDPNNRPVHPIESWFTEREFDDLFPKANIGWGPNTCWPYSYDAFKIALRYFPNFANEHVENIYTDEQNAKRELAAFFAHIIQETGENDVYLYQEMPTQDQADACFYRGGFYNWFEGGPESSFLPNNTPGYNPSDGNKCMFNGLYCLDGELYTYFYPCSAERSTDNYYKGCYFGRGPLQLSYNFNYGQFNDWLATQNIYVDLLSNPNLVLTKMDPPLAILGSLWFYMTPQPPKPAIHDIILGNWVAGIVNQQSNYQGPIFGPTNLVINSECTGLDAEAPGGAGENRRIRAFQWFCNYFGVDPGPSSTLSCKNMPQTFEKLTPLVSWQPDWLNDWRADIPCLCSPASYQGMILYYQDGYFPQSFVNLNEDNRIECIKSIYAQPDMYSMTRDNSKCLGQPMNLTYVLP